MKNLSEELRKASSNLAVIDDAKLGRYLKMYLADAIHNNWDGWPERDRTGAKALVVDLHQNIVGGLLEE